MTDVTTTSFKGVEHFLIQVSIDRAIILNDLTDSVSRDSKNTLVPTDQVFISDLVEDS